MTPKQFGQTYLRFEANIVKVLRKQRIYDEDLMHDTYIDLYEHARKEKITDFVNTFVAFYRARHQRRIEYNSHFEICDDATIIEKYDRIDEDDLAYREKIEKTVDVLMERLKSQPLPGERNHQRAVKILQLYRRGLSFAQIAQKMNTSKQSVHQLFERTIEKLRVMHR